jgi:hypothetical protein
MMLSRRMKMKITFLRFMFAVGSVTVLAGCGSTTKVSRAIAPASAMGNGATSVPRSFEVGEFKSTVDRLPPHFLTEVQSYLTTELRIRGILAGPGSGAKVNVTATYYRMRSGMNRMMFGAMAGKDGIESSVTVVDSTTGEVIGESTISTYNVTAVGDQGDVARMHAKEIANFLQNKTG